MGIFKAYDVRGIFGEDLTEEIAYKIGRAFVTFLKCKEVVIGNDMRDSGKILVPALIKGITDQGADVIKIGLSSTPMFYYACHDKQAGIMVTASHNPAKYNGFKLCRENATPISGDTGIKEIEQLVLKNNFKVPNKKGNIVEKNVFNDFIQFNLNFGKGIKKFKVVYDAGNGMGGYTDLTVYRKLGLQVIPLFTELDGNFPNHEADPIKPQNRIFAEKAVIENKADLGILTDGDGDRVVFVDEKGQGIAADLILALIGSKIVETRPGATVLYDLRSSRIVKEVVEQKKGKAIECRVGHAFIKQQMRKENALVAGELAAHFYYKEHFFTESALLTAIFVMKMMSETGKKLSELIAPLKKYFCSGEINSEVHDKEAVIKKLAEKYKDGKVSWLDGVKVTFKDWWFNVRPSNTEPLLRLNLEADSQKLMEEKKKEILEIIRKS
ncbi:phosphomannomutase/phosphoglucomutase [Candidatus Woesearchaeota archaeon]|nr:phosphomannomutase/phosphoglucomutase [Candidatus Woesearchaeota archaeon]